MSDNSEPIEPEQAIAPISHRRILWAMAAVAVAGGLGALYFVSTQFGIGVLLGGSLALVNYYWLKVSLKRVFDKAAAGGNPGFLATKYLLRYLVFGLVLVIVFLTKTLPIVAVLLGLASFAVAIIVEALILLFASFFKK